MTTSAHKTTEKTGAAVTRDPYYQDSRSPAITTREAPGAQDDEGTVA